MGNTSKDKEESKFGEYMRELYRLSPEELPSHAAVCREAKIDRNFYNRVKSDGFQGGVPEPKNVSALCNAIVLKESLKKPITAQEVLDGLIDAKLLPEGSKLESEKDEQEDIKVKFKENARRQVEKMEDIIDILNILDDIEKDRKNKLSKVFNLLKNKLSKGFNLLKNKLSKGFGLRKNKSSEDFGSWK